MLAPHSRRGATRQHEHESVVGSLVSSRLTSPRARSIWLSVFWSQVKRTRDARRDVPTLLSPELTSPQLTKQKEIKTFCTKKKADSTNEILIKFVELY
jgi:hypothetical protein